MYLAQALVGEENQIIVFASDQEELGSSQEDFENVEVEIAQLEIPVLGGAELLLLGLDGVLDLTHDEPTLAREDFHTLHDVAFVVLDLRFDLLHFLFVLLTDDGSQQASLILGEQSLLAVLRLKVFFVASHDFL